MRDFFSLFFKGIFVGLANIIPGVSGGTIAVVLRIFDQLIDSINNFFKTPKKYIAFLLPLFLGAGTGIVLFSKLLDFLLKYYSFPTTLFFVGLVCGSIPLIYSQACKKSVKPVYFLVSVISFLFVVCISLLKQSSANVQVNINAFWIFKLIIAGIISSSAMVIPGISGSFVMVLLGIYNIILTSISDLVTVISSNFKGIFSSKFFSAIFNIISSKSFLILLFVGIGIILGVIIVSRIIDFLLKKAFSLTYFCILGLIFGSIFAIFKDPLTYSSYTTTVPLPALIVSVFTFILGFFIAIKLGKE